MLLQTNSYVVPAEKRAEHIRLMRRFRQILARIGCDNFEIYEQVSANWGSGPVTGRYVQIMRFHDRKHQLAVQNAERTDAAAQELIAEFCELINYPYQQQQNLFAVGYYNSVLPVAPLRLAPSDEQPEPEQTHEHQSHPFPQPHEAPIPEHAPQALSHEPEEHPHHDPTPSHETATEESLLADLNSQPHSHESHHPQQISHESADPEGPLVEFDDGLGNLSDHLDLDDTPTHHDNSHRPTH